MNWPTVIENDDGIRPAGRQDTCLYCNRKIGQPHKRDCVTITKVIKARYIFEIEVEVPFFWGKEEFEFHRNESSWCADNAFGDIEKHIKNDCACNCFKAEFVKEVDVTPKQKQPVIHKK